MSKSLTEMDNEIEERALGIAQAGRGKVLLVDDDPDLLSSLSDLLQLEGYEVTVANGVESAGRATAAFVPEVALLDVKLGSFNGIELIGILKKQQPDLACVIMTGLIRWRSSKATD